MNVSAGNGVAIKIKDICQLFISAMASGATTMIAQNLSLIHISSRRHGIITLKAAACAAACAPHTPLCLSLIHISFFFITRLR